MKQKILFIISSLGGGGAEKVLIDILQSFDYTKYEVHLLLKYRSGVYLNHIPTEVKVISMYPKGMSRLGRYADKLLRCIRLHYWYSRIKDYSRLRSLIIDHYNVIISSLEGEGLLFHEWLLDKSDRNISWVQIDLSHQHWSLPYFKNQQHECEAYSKMDAIVLVSNGCKAGFEKLFNVDTQKVIIYNMIDTKKVAERSQEFEVEKKGFVVCAVGRLHTQKRFDRIIRLAASCKEKGIKAEFRILGEGSERRKLQRLINRLEVEDYVKLYGFQKNPYPFMRAADIYLSCSANEGYPLVVCEALSLGLPVIATNVTGSSEIIGEDSEYGLLVEEDDASILKGFMKMYDNEPLRMHYSKKGKERSTVFAKETIMTDIYRVVQDL